MHMKKKTKLLMLLSYLILSILVTLLFSTSLINNIELRLEDSIYQSPAPISEDVAVIGFDAASFNAYGQFETWSRDKIADLINKLNADPNNKPKVIAVDVGFYSDNGRDESGNLTNAFDIKLVDAVKNGGNVILNCACESSKEVYESTSTIKEVSKISTVEYPFKELKEACLSFGHCNFGIDDDGVVRYAYGNVKYNDEQIPSFAYQVYNAYTTKSSDFGKIENKFYIKYSGNPGDYFYCSIKDVLDDEYPVQAFKDKAVFIGAYASGTQDNYYTSISKEVQMYGVEIHANVVLQLIDQNKIIKVPNYVGILIISVLMVGSSLLFVFYDKKYTPFIVIGILLIYILTCFILFKVGNLILVLLGPVVGLVLLTVVQILAKYIITSQEKKRLMANYSRYLSKDVAEQIASSNEDIFKLGGIKKDIAVLFVDIRGFTTLSESLSPEDVVEMLNSYLAITTKAIFDNEGTVDKFIGDATMGLFNAPLDLDDYIYKAVCAGLDMSKNASELLYTLKEELRGRVGFGVGINCGDCVVGNIGTSFRMEYTAIGDVVNTASRLEGVAKAGEVIVSEAVYLATCDRIEYDDMDSVRLKGKKDEVKIYKAVGRKA